MKNKQHKDVIWYSIDNKKKKPVAYSTRSASDLVGILSEECETIQDVYNAINYDDEAKDIIKKYIDLCFGNEIAAKHFKYWRYNYDQNTSFEFEEANRIRHEKYEKDEREFQITVPSLIL